MVTALSQFNLAFHYLLNPIRHSFQFEKKPRTNKFYFAFQGSKEVTVIFSGNGLFA